MSDVLTDLAAGLSYAEIEAKHHISVRRLQRLAVRNGIARSSHLSCTERQLIVDDYRAGLTISQIQEKSGRSRWAIKKAVTDAGVLRTRDEGPGVRYDEAELELAGGRWVTTRGGVKRWVSDMTDQQRRLRSVLHERYGSHSVSWTKSPTMSDPSHQTIGRRHDELLAENARHTRFLRTQGIDDDRAGDAA